MSKDNPWYAQMPFTVDEQPVMRDDTNGSRRNEPEN